MSTDASLIETLSASARRALEPHTPEQPYALLDFPGHPNVGDSAIWAGEMAYLRRYASALPAYVASLRNFSMDDLRQRCPTGPIYIHGGGNFGDLWPHHQAFRNRLLEQTRGQPLIQFPQSIHFASPERRDEAARLIERHGRFTLFVRDHESLHLARRHFQCDTILCPDMAFFIGPIARPRAPELDVLCLLRTDVETSGPAEHSDSGLSLRVTDWLVEPRTRLRLAKACGALRAALLQGPGAFRFGAFNSAAEARVRRGSDLLASGRAVVTDRLHTHILCLLLGIPHAVLDNNYGKVGRFISCWTSASPLTHRSTSMRSALDWAKGQAVST
ncbi:MAG: polysaccharide pyruvyl transferase family protein [Phenylobacterium sp.]